MEEFFGRYKVVLDSKGRVNVPARYREITEKYGNGEQEFVLTRGTEKYVAMVPLKEWKKIMRDLNRKVDDGKKRRTLNLRVNYYASQQSVDKQGRINIPADLIKYAKFEKEVVIVGTGKKIGIWNPQELEKHLQNAEKEFQEHSDVLDI